MNMNAIKSIKIKNVKGKDKLSLSFNKLHPNMVNLLVAPNGFGKSTIVQTFNSLKPRSLSLNNDDFYQSNQSNSPELEVEFTGNNHDILIANNRKNDLYSEYDIKVINNAVVAKSAYSTAGADLKIEPIIIYDKIPEKIDTGYNFTTITNNIACNKRIFKNISSFFKNIENLKTLFTIKDSLLKCSTQVRTTNAINKFLNTIPNVGNANVIKNAITIDEIEMLISNNHISCIYSTISNCEYFSNYTNVDIVLSMIQIIKWYEINHELSNDFLKNQISYEEYKINKIVLNERLTIFNTTGREIAAKKDGQKLVVKFVNANKMSNGERDVLVFLTELFRYGINFKKEKGILLIDEIFDYLDGSNLIVAQYFLSKFIEEQRKKENLIYPLIFTHLDPDMFKNYYFKKMKIHYLLDNSQNALQSDIVKVIQSRDIRDDYTSKYLLHFHPDNIEVPEEISNITSTTFPTTSHDFKLYAYNEVTEKYLSDLSYNPVLVLVGIRLKVEDYVYNLLQTEEQKNKFIEEHSTIKKFEYASQFVNVPELLYILQPIYNDTLHLNGSDRDKEKIKSSSLKLYNIPIKNVIKKIFEL